ncbi:FG-GAP repeat domain-containing protein [Shewanella colwelliana]|uniref:FG-GAP repeat domain-containing protein n=1 Tax=Shewanella colwelliana TaxID=23 RepID=UPI0022AFE5ED|nr:VCBS repeat-containing protein [Shewanella colwelliana]MCZ4337217.1 VCBS repeat-containing protein [Shewanella colwelliana]
MENVKLAVGSLVLALTTLLGSAHALAKQSSEQIELLSHTVETEFRLTHPILSVDLTASPGKELVAIGVDDNQSRWLSLYEFNQTSGQYGQKFKQRLPNAFFSFDLTKPSERFPQQAAALYFQSSEQLFQLVVSDEGLDFEPKQSIAPLILKSRVDFISRGDFVHDLNQDGLDDFVINSFSQTELLLAQAEGDVIRQILPIKPQVLLYRDGARYTQAILYFADMDLDGRNDIVKIAEGEFEVYAQQENGQFDTVARFVPVSLAISGVNWWNKRDAYGEELDQSDLIYRKVEQLQDINNDGLVDMIVRYTKSSGVLDRVNDYEIYLGQNTLTKLQFPKKPDSVIRADGTLTGFELVDIDGDKRDEVMVSGFDIGLSQIIGALVSGGIDQDVHLFKMNAESGYANKANVSKEVELSFSLTSGQSGSPVVKLADLNGDGLQDLMLSDGEQALRLYLGDGSKGLFDEDSDGFKLQLPQEGSALVSDDLNADGKDDLIIKYGRQDSKALQYKFVVIMAQ